LSRMLSPLTTETMRSLDPMQRLSRCTFDNVSSCVRRSVWCNIPFRPTAIAEDLEWAQEVLLAGHYLEFVATSVVIHSHERSGSYEFARTYLLHRRLFELFEVCTIPTLLFLSRAVGNCLVRHFQYQRRSSALRLGALARGMSLAVAW